MLQSIRARLMIRIYRVRGHLLANLDPLGLVPRQTGTGGRIRQLGISKRGDPYLRTLLMHGARAIIARKSHRCPWIRGLLERRPYSVVVAAIANKLARTIWAILARGQQYEPGRFSPAAH